MLELDARAVLSLGDEAYLDFRDQPRIELPVCTDVPRKHETRVRLPGKYAPPVTRAAIVTPLIPTAPYAGLDHGVHRVGLADLVNGQRPPSAHLLGEDSRC